MWIVKILAKLLIRFCRIPYRVITRIGIMRHGRMDSLEYAQGVFDKAVRNAGPRTRIVMELGPGDSVTSAYLSWRAGMRAILVDSGDYATSDESLYTRLLEKPVISREHFLSLTGGQYFTRGLQSLMELADNSVDFVFSNAVLEHVRAGEVELLLDEVARVMKPGARFFHEIDFRDHLSGGLNNLRFPNWFWENNWVASAGFYTNRKSFTSWRASLERRFEIVSVDIVPFSTESAPSDVILQRRKWNKEDSRIAVARFVGRKPE